MGSHKSKGSTYPEPSVAPTPPDYIVTGEVSPDCTGNYYYYSDWNGEPCYQREDGYWYIWWDGLDVWFISYNLGLAYGAYWYKSPPITGNYTPYDGASGIATVSAGA